MTPAQFHAALQQNCPQFQQRTREGHLMQQDAEECWTSIVSTLGRKLRPPAPDGGPVDGALMRQLFGIEFVTKLKCEATGARSSRAFSAHPRSLAGSSRGEAALRCALNAWPEMNRHRFAPAPQARSARWRRHSSHSSATSAAPPTT